MKRMCKSFFLSSIYNDKAYDEDKVNDLLHEFIHNSTDRVIVLALLEGQPIAQLAATVQPLLFNQSRIATEVLWWVDEEHRRSRVGYQLIEAFEYWAKTVVKADYCQLCSLNGEMVDVVGQYYEKLGYKLIEKAYLKQCQQ